LPETRGIDLPDTLDASPSRRRSKEDVFDQDGDTAELLTSMTDETKL
jgi:hypothetical protein